MSRRHPAGALSRRYLVAFLCIATLIVLDQLLIQPELARLAFDAPVINVSGRQRMLSQRLAKSALVLQQADRPLEQATRSAELADIVKLWTRSHLGLQRGDPEMNLPGDNPPVVQAAFGRIEPHFQAIRVAAERIVAQSEAAAANGTVVDVSADVDEILRHETSFLREMDHLVGLYETETRSHVERLQWTSWTIAAAILATMAALHLIAISPATALLERQYVETEDQYTAVVDSINEGLMRLDPQGRIVFANRQFCTLSGRPAEDLRGRVAVTLFGGPQPFLFMNPAPADNALPMACELELFTAQGDARSCWVSPCRLVNEHQSTTGWMVLVMDVTEQRAAERKAQQLVDQLAHADRLKSMGEVAAGLAHEVNQPLGAISNYAEGCLARIDAGDADVHEFEHPLRRILAAALRAGGITRRVKQFSQKRPHTVAVADLNSLVQETIELFSGELRRRSIACSTQLASEPLNIECDALQLGQVIANLLQNSMQASDQQPTARRSVTIETARLSEDEVSLIVRDDGPGFSEEILGRLFERFSTSRADGMGMGLSIVRSIVEAHGGSIIAGNLAVGAQVKVNLPVRQPTTLSRVEETLHVG